VMVAFNNSAKAREFRVSLSGTAAQGSQGVKVLFGDGVAEIAGNEIHVSTPGKSVSIFLLR
jgi:hypothetical protein